MTWLKQIMTRQRIFSDLSEEIAEHLAEKTEALVAGGMSREEAEYLAASSRWAFVKLRRGELIAPGAAALRVREHRLDAAAVLALQPRDRREPLLDRLEAPGGVLELLAVAADLR